MDEKMRYGALYIRVSTDKQEELSPDAQKRLLLDYANSTIFHFTGLNLHGERYFRPEGR